MTTTRNCEGSRRTAPMPHARSLGDLRLADGSAAGPCRARERIRTQ
jgi:hypothetical protein